MISRIGTRTWCQNACWAATLRDLSHWRRRRHPSDGRLSGKPFGNLKELVYAKYLVLWSLKTRERFLIHILWQDIYFWAAQPTTGRLHIFVKYLAPYRWVQVNPRWALPTRFPLKLVSSSPSVTRSNSDASLSLDSNYQSLNFTENWALRPTNFKAIHQLCKTGPGIISLISVLEISNISSPG